MSRQSAGPRLYVRKYKGKSSLFVILDGTTERSTGCRADDRAGAEKALQEYLARKHSPQWRKGDPSQVVIADVLNYYLTEHAPTLAHPELAATHVEHLLKYWGNKVCSFVTLETCRKYRRARAAGEIGRSVKEVTARRELVTLKAALHFAYKNQKLLHVPYVELGQDGERRERYLEPTEMARLLAGALGFTPGLYDVRTREPILDMRYWWRPYKPLRHIARFILIAFYTGTRHEAILKLRWQANTEGGWFDLANRRLYRKGVGERETSKRRTPAPIHDSLYPHLVRWQRLTVKGPAEYAGELSDSAKRGFGTARERACLGPDVVPHVLKHTCATLLLRGGVSTFEVAGYLGTSEKVIQQTYGHHSADFMSNAASSKLGRNLGTNLGNRPKYGGRIVA